ncbi:MAG: ABC transporter, partial [Ignavibacteria bacterium]|nr:ABC transporter [Ignavibacteria bacterium]
MNNILSIYRKELRSYLYSPIPYILIIVFMIITGWFFTTNLFLNEVVSLRGVLDVIPFILLFYIPAISMRTFSEEKKSGTIELLMTKPITEYDVVIGKFLSTITLAAFTFLPTVVYVISLTFLGKLDFGPVIS